jgi:23S rRNA G2069 N7-methylase RlmK/C1962 C5-methylase RlmI
MDATLSLVRAQRPLCLLWPSSGPIGRSGVAAKDAKKRIRQVTYQSQSSDHPIIWGMENTHYLKFLIVEVCDK